MLFNGMNRPKLETVYRDADCSVPFERLEEMYKTATAQKYSFFYIDCHSSQYRKNFDELFVV